MALADRWDTVIAACEIAAVARILPTLVELGWTSPSVLAAQRPRWSTLDLNDEETSMLQIPLTTWLEPHQAGPPDDLRRDLPTINPSTGGSQHRLEILPGGHLGEKQLAPTQQQSQNLGDDSQGLAHASVATDPSTHRTSWGLPQSGRVQVRQAVLQCSPARTRRSPR